MHPNPSTLCALIISLTISRISTIAWWFATFLKFDELCEILKINFRSESLVKHKGRKRKGKELPSVLKLFKKNASSSAVVEKTLYVCILFAILAYIILGISDNRFITYLTYSACQSWSNISRFKALLTWLLTFISRSTKYASIQRTIEYLTIRTDLTFKVTIVTNTRVVPSAASFISPWFTVLTRLWRWSWEFICSTGTNIVCMATLQLKFYSNSEG